MRAIASLLCAITIAASAVVAVGGFQETLTNEAVVVLIKAGLSPATVITKIKSSSTQFDVSTKGLIDLKSKGVPDDVIQAMVEAGASPPARSSADPVVEPIRIFLMKGATGGAPTQQPLERTLARQRMAIGFMSFGTQIVMPGKNAVIQVEEMKPTFILRFPDDNSRPADYVLTRLGPSDEGGGRRIDPDNAVRVDVEKTGAREYRVTPNRDLRRGEYCFYRPADLKEGWPGQTGTLHVFDFGVIDPRRR